MNLREFLLTRYPGEFGPDDIVGVNYPPPWYATYFLLAAQMVQWCTLGLVFFGTNALRAIGYPNGFEPEWYKQFKENKMGAFVMVFFTNSVAQSMTSTGAFEGAVDGKVCFSKLEVGRMPNLQEIVRILGENDIKMPEAIE